jgi:hypothetical protein
MSRPAIEVADIIRSQGDQFLRKFGSGMEFQQLKALRAIKSCRTSALGGHIDVCPECRHQANSFNSCRNRSCPKCQAQLRRRWIAARERELLDRCFRHQLLLRCKRYPRLIDNDRNGQLFEHDFLRYPENDCRREDLP